MGLDWKCPPKLLLLGRSAEVLHVRNTGKVHHADLCNQKVQGYQSKCRSLQAATGDNCCSGTAKESECSGKRSDPGSSAAGLLRPADMPIAIRKQGRLLVLAFVVLVSCDCARADLKLQQFSTDQIKKCPASGKVKPPDAQRVNINGLPFSGAPWLKATFPS